METKHIFMFLSQLKRKIFFTISKKIVILLYFERIYFVIVDVKTLLQTKVTNKINSNCCSSVELYLQKES